jgi:hypothetical protein
MIWHIYYRSAGDHVHCRVFCGPIEGALGHCGNLTFRQREFTDFSQRRKVLAMDFRTEMKDDGSPDIDLRGGPVFAPLV